MPTLRARWDPAPRQVRQRVALPVDVEMRAANDAGMVIGVGRALAATIAGLGTAVVGRKTPVEACRDGRPQARAVSRSGRTRVGPSMKWSGPLSWVVTGRWAPSRRTQPDCWPAARPVRSHQNRRRANAPALMAGVPGAVCRQPRSAARSGRCRGDGSFARHRPRLAAGPAAGVPPPAQSRASRVDYGALRSNVAGCGRSTGTPCALQVPCAHRRSRRRGVACTIRW